MIVKVEKLNPKAMLPTQGSAYAAGYDLCACIDCDEIAIPAHSTVKIGTGLKIEIPEGYFGAIFARSGIAAKQGLRPANCVGVCDSDYRGEYIVALHNDGVETQIVHDGESIAQLAVLPYASVTFIESDDLSSTERGTGGFGSTGK